MPSDPARTAASVQPPIEVGAKPGQRLGMPVTRFLSTYWQKRPLLVRARRGAEFVSPITPDDLAGLACEAFARSELVVREPAGEVRREHGPFAEARFSALPANGWVLRVDDVDKWDRDVAALLDLVAFLPRWRIAGISACFAAAGSRGDDDVGDGEGFLIQASGQGRIRLAHIAASKARRVDTQELMLAPGDVLYLPPGTVGQDLASGESFAFRIRLHAPGVAELLLGLTEQVADTLADDAHYRDPNLDARSDAFAVDAGDVARVRDALSAWLAIDDERLGREFARFISGHGLAHSPAPRPRSLGTAQFDARIGKGAALARHPFARMATRPGKRGRTWVFLAGQALDVSTRLAKLLGRDEIDAGDVAALTDSERADLLKCINLGLIGFVS